MGDFEDCLSKLAIIATSNILDNNEAQIEAALDRFLRSPKNSSASDGALRKLQDGFLALQLDGGVADHIRRSIESRMSAVELEASP